jgi:polyvinyl alcohol dehydrogenase (cytochrome)
MPAFAPLQSSAEQPMAAQPYFGDAHAQVYALDAASGALRWKVTVETHLDAMITGAIAFHEGRLYVPVSSIEEGTAAIPRTSAARSAAASPRWTPRPKADLEDLHDCRGSPAHHEDQLGDAALGSFRGGDLVRAALDPDRNRLYVTTGDSYSESWRRRRATRSWRSPWTPDESSDSADAGGRRLERRVSRSDRRGPVELSPTSGTRSRLFKLADSDDCGLDGRRVLLAGQKSGVLWTQPGVGRVDLETQAGDGGVLGGIEWGFATDGSVASVRSPARSRRRRARRVDCSAVNVADGRTSLVGSAAIEHLRWTDRMQYRAAGCRHGHPRRRLFRKSGRAPPRLRTGPAV